MSSIAATLMASFLSNTHGQGYLGSAQFFMKTPTTSYPARLSRAAATDESTPPDIPAKTFFPFFALNTIIFNNKNYTSPFRSSQKKCFAYSVLYIPDLFLYVFFYFSKLFLQVLPSFQRTVLNPGGGSGVRQIFNIRAESFA